jgi:phytoene dehydrogenase-like protein
MADVDAVVVGGGHNGLVSALYLARAGWRVLVIEQAAEVGGGLKTAELSPGFLHDLYATNLGSFSSSPAYRDFQTEFEAAGVRLIPSATPYASSYGDRAVRIYADSERTAAALAVDSAGDAEGWRRLSALYARTAPRFLPLFYTPMPSWPMTGQVMRIAARPLDALRLLRLLTQSSHDFVNDALCTPEAKGVLASWAYHLDFAPRVRGGAIFALIAAMSGQAKGLPLVEGGARNLTRALVELVRRAGVRVMTHTEVTRIQVRRNQAVAVMTSSGETMSVGRAVIANVTPRRLFGGLVAAEELDDRFFRRIGKYRYGPGTFIVHLSLDRAPTWRAGDDLAGFGYVHVCGGVEDIETTYTQCLAGQLPARPMLVVSQPTAADPTRTPAGCAVVRLHARTVPQHILGDAAGAIRATSWATAKQPFTERLLDLLEEHTPGLRASIRGLTAFTPDEIEADNPNFVGGDCVSGSHHLDQNFFFRPLRGWSRYAMPIEKLYLTGAPTWPGGGVNGGSGYLLARQLLARE